MVVDIGYSIKTMMMLTFHNLDQKSENIFLEYCMENPYITKVESCDGRYDYSITIMSKSKQGSMNIKKDIRTQFSKIIKDFESIDIIKSIKDNKIKMLANETK